ncbi:MAG TPA: aromatic amino acid lyase, partial [Dongiaceae bacterium]
VAWQSEAVRISEAALQRIARCRESFLQLIDKDPDLVIYGVTTAMGELASRRLTLEEREHHARLKPFAAATSFGNPLPERVVRGIVLARLANFLDGHAATTPRIALAVAAMLDGGPLPQVAASGQGGAGEILALYPLFAELAMRFDLEVKERGSLINGSPAAAALLGDAALAARRRVQLAHQVFALSIEAFRAPLEHYDAALEALWGDEHEAAALQGLRGYLTGAGSGRRNYQAPVSYRILPRVLAQFRRAVEAAEAAAETSLKAITDNPVFLAPSPGHPKARVYSTGGYHNAMAHPAMDNLAAATADLCLLTDRHSSKLLHGNHSLLPDQLQAGEAYLGCLGMVQVGYAEQARRAAQRNFLPGSEGGGFGQNDVAPPTFLAWRAQEEAGSCLDAGLAILAAIGSQALFVTDRQAPPALAGLVGETRRHLPPVEQSRILAGELAALAAAFRARVFDVAPALEE